MRLIAWLSKYWKAVVAFVGAVGTWAGTALVDGHISSSEWALLAAALATVGGVYGVRNAPSDTDT